MKQYIMGVDLGKKNDYSVISVIKEGFHRKAKPTVQDLEVGHEGEVVTTRVWQILHLERIELGTDYTRVIEIVKELLSTAELANNTDLVVDATGVGAPVVDFMRHSGLNPVPLLYTSGNQTNMGSDGIVRVPKADLANTLLFYWNSGRLKYPSNLPFLDKLLLEMGSFVVKITKSVNMTYEALQETDHDDMVMSVAMAVWWGSYTRPWAQKTNRLDKIGEDAYDPRTYLTQ